MTEFLSENSYRLLAVNYYYKLTILHRCLIELWRRSDVFILNFEHISHLILLFLILTKYGQNLPKIRSGQPATVTVLVKISHS